MHLLVIGSGTALPHPQRGASGYACIAEDGTVLLLECGPGSTRRWPGVEIDFPDVRGIFVSHHHVDHCGDLPAVLFGRNVVEPPVDTPLVLFGPIGHMRHVLGLEAIYGPGVTDTLGVRRVVELDDRETAELGPFHLEARGVHHAPGALGVRVTCDGTTLAFSGDSGPGPALLELCRDVDVALLECSYPSFRESQQHLNTRTAAVTAEEAGVPQLVLTHFYPSCDPVDVRGEVRSAGYTGRLVLAYDGLRIPIAPRTAPESR